MKFKNIIISLATATAIFSLTSCDKFLDMQQTEQMTFEKIWEKKSTTENYLYNVYGFLQTEADPISAIRGSQDDISLTWHKYEFWDMINGATNASNPGYDIWWHSYRGIREANIFMQNVDLAKGKAEDMTNEEIEAWKVEARFLRAYFYYNLLRNYGPVIMLGDKILDPTSDITEYINVERNTWDECATWVINELDECAKLLPDDYPDTYKGKPTKATALAVKARFAMYDARPLFNGCDFYKSLKNAENGKLLFRQANDPAKWQAAVTANKAVIDLNQFSLIKEMKDGNVDPYKSFDKLFFEAWNSEIIWGRWTNIGSWANHTNPRGNGGTAYNGCGVTQKMVDAFAMSNGVFPIIGYEDNGASPIIDPQSGYKEDGATNFEHPYDKIKKNTPNMYVNREPRFYFDVFWSGQTWFQQKSRNKVINLNTGGNSGPGAGEDYSRSAYIARKFMRASDEAHNGKYTHTSRAIIRLAEIYLNYVEALNEVDSNHADIKKYWNEIRSRAGIPNIEVSYPGFDSFSKERKRELIQQERMVELHDENIRYYDARTWMI
ncbi:MAG: RagB/SusD family nutrient uptake outer membrane protein, partial [Rikenellaceae bacterium]